MLYAVHIPSNAGEAVALLTATPGAQIVAGGTLLVGDIQARPSAISDLVSLAAIGAPVRGIKVTGGAATIGATTTLADLEADTALAFLRPALDSIGSPTLRNMATVGGNFFAKAGYGDLATCLIALDATCTFLGPDGSRTAPAAQAVHGAAPDEVMVSVAFAVPETGTWRYHKAMRRGGNSASIATIAAVVLIAGGVVDGPRVAISGATARPVRAMSVEAVLDGKALGTQSASAAGEAALADVETFSDAYASAWYRARVLPVHVRRALVGA